MDHPREYRYSLGHCWAHVVGESARVGVCPKLIADGSVTSVTLPLLGAAVDEGALVVTVKVGTTTYNVNSPVAGSIVLVNERLIEEPGLVGTDPFSAGWLYEVQLSYDETLESVMDVDSYIKILS